MASMAYIAFLITVLPTYVVPSTSTSVCQSRMDSSWEDEDLIAGLIWGELVGLISRDKARTDIIKVNGEDVSKEDMNTVEFDYSRVKEARICRFRFALPP